MSEGSELPEGIQKLRSVVYSFFTAESRLKGVRYEPSPTDVFICTTPKSGTTWMQQICHGLRSGGDMSFEEISLVIPTLEMAHDQGHTDLHAPQPYAPQMFKTHLWRPSCPKGAGKYIVVVRRPADAALSFYLYLCSWFVSNDDVSLEEFVEWVYMKRGAPKHELEAVSYFHHLLSWYPHRLDDNVLWLHFEDLKLNLRECVRLVAEFLDIGRGDESLQELVTLQASFEFMKKHSTKFDEHPLKLARNEAAGLSRNAGFSENSCKVRNGETDVAKDVMSKQMFEKIDEKWRQVIMSETGYCSYEAFREGVNKELGRNFAR